MRVRKKPVEVEAIQWTGTNTEEIRDFFGVDNQKDYQILSTPHSPPEILICTLEGIYRASINDFIIRGVRGEYYPCKPDIFYDTYDIL